VEEMLKIVCMDYITESMIWYIIIWYTYCWKRKIAILLIQIITGDFIAISWYDIPIVEREKLMQEMLKNVSGPSNW